MHPILQHAHNQQKIRPVCPNVLVERLGMCCHQGRMRALAPRTPCMLDIELDNWLIDPDRQGTRTLCEHKLP